MLVPISFRLSVPLGMRTTVDLDLLEALVPAQVLHVAIRHVSGQIEGITRQVAALHHAAVVEVKLTQGESAGGGDQLTSGLDSDLAEAGVDIERGRRERSPLAFMTPFTSIAVVASYM